MVEEKNFLKEAGEFFAKSGTYVFSIVIGLIGKFGMDLMLKKKYTRWQWVGIGFVSVFMGYITSVMCEVYAWDKMKHILPPFATMFGQWVALYIVFNYKKILDNGLQFVIKSFGPKK